MDGAAQAADLGTPKIVSEGAALHELSVALGLLEGVRETANRDAVERVLAVHVRVGALTGIAPDALQFSWELASAGTVAEKSTLKIDHVPLTVFCDRCATERQPAPASGLVCPVCSTACPTIVHGRELQLVAMEVPE